MDNFLVLNPSYKSHNIDEGIMYDLSFNGEQLY